MELKERRYDRMDREEMIQMWYEKREQIGGIFRASFDKHLPEENRTDFIKNDLMVMDVALSIGGLYRYTGNAMKEICESMKRTIGGHVQ